MILELADIRIPPGQQAAFDEAIVRGVTTVISARPRLPRLEGHRGRRVARALHPADLLGHARRPTVHFRGGPLFPAVARHRRPFFCSRWVEHFVLVGKSD